MNKYRGTDFVGNALKNLELILFLYSVLLN